MTAVLLLIFLSNTHALNFPSKPYDPNFVAPERNTSEPFNYEHMLRNYLLHEQNYDPSVRGVRDAREAVNVRLGATLTHISKIEEKNQVLQLSIYLEQEWRDHRLFWNYLEFDNITKINIEPHHLWMPDIVLFNNAENYKEFKPTNVAIYANGLILWAPPIQIRSVCRLDLKMFPFDYQICDLKFGSWMHDNDFVCSCCPPLTWQNRSINFDSDWQLESESLSLRITYSPTADRPLLRMNISVRNDTISLDDYIDNGEWEIVAQSVRRVDEPNCQRRGRTCAVFSRVIFSIYLKRRVLFYMYNIIIPCSMLSVLTLMQFWLPPESGEKVTLGLTVLLAYSVFSFNIGESMPEISEVIPLVAIYIMTIMGTSAVSVTLSVVVLNLHHAGSRTRRVPPWLKFLAFRILGPLSFQKNCSQKWEAHTDGSTFQRIFHLLGNCMNNAERRRPGGRSRPTDICPPTYLAPPSCRSRGIVRRKALTFQPRRGSPGIHLSELLMRAGILLDRCEVEKESDTTAAEWRAVARVLDLFLFWFVFVITAAITFGMIVVAPLMNQELPTELVDALSR